MSGGLQNLSSREALAALSWLVEAGVDSLVDDAPYPWLAAPVAAQEPPPPVAEIIAPCEADAVVEAAATVVGVDSLGALEAKLREFDGCALATHGSLPLFADGTPGSALMIVGDMPSAGAVFGGDAGLLLDRMLAAIGLGRDSAYLANLVYWPTPGGRAPAPAEIAACAPFLRRQIELARPRMILALGGAAAAALTGQAAGINRLRGRWQDLSGGNLPVLSSFHPAQLLVQPTLKALAWQDLQALKARLDA